MPLTNVLVMIAHRALPLEVAPAMPSLDNAPQQLESHHHASDHSQATNLSHEANALHTPMSGPTGASAGAGDFVSQKDVDTIHHGFDNTAALYGGPTGGHASGDKGGAHASSSGSDYGAAAGGTHTGDQGVGSYSAQATSGGDAPTQVYDGSAGKGKDSAEGNGTSYAMQDGGSLTLGENNKAQITDAKGQTQDYNYYSHNDDHGWHTLYKDSQSPREIADSMRQFRIDPKAGAGASAGSGSSADGGHRPIELSEPNYSAMHSSRLTPAERDFVDKSVPEGSKPIGMGIHRQAWQTPDNKAVVVGTNDHRTEAPFILPAEKTEVSGNKKAETFPLGENKSITKEDVAKFVKHWADKGWEMLDNKVSNFARTSDGKMWRVDPDDVFNWNE